MKKDTLTNLIEKSQEEYLDEPRNYIGASSIGSDCLRQIWYEFKGEKSTSVPAKTRRTWAIGKNLEGLIYEWLVVAGVNITVMQCDTFAEGLPFFRGNFDGMIKIGEKLFVLEIKTAKD